MAEVLSFLLAAFAWIDAHPTIIFLAVGLLAYLLANYMKRPDAPKPQWLFLLWAAVEWAMLATRKRWGFDWKGFGIESPAPAKDPAITPLAKPGIIAAAMLAIAMTLGVSSVGCIPAKVVTTIVDTLSDALFAVDQIDAAFGAFCAYSPEMCSKVRAQYETKRGAVIHAIRFGQNAVEAYNELFSMLESLGVVSKPGSLKASPTGFTAWQIKSPFEGK